MGKSKLTPRKGAAGRGTSKGEGRDMPMRGAAGRTPSPARGAYPKDNFPKPTGGQARGFKPTDEGAYTDNTMVNRQQDGPVVREGGGTGKPAGSTGSPWKSSGGNGPGNSTKNPKAN